MPPVSSPLTPLLSTHPFSPLELLRPPADRFIVHGRWRLAASLEPLFLAAEGAAPSSIVTILILVTRRRGARSWAQRLPPPFPVPPGRHIRVPGIDVVEPL